MMTTLIFNFTENETCMTTLLYSTIYLSDSIWFRNKYSCSLSFLENSSYKHFQNPQKCSNTLKQFVGNSQQIVWGWYLKDKRSHYSDTNLKKKKESTETGAFRIAWNESDFTHERASFKSSRRQEEALENTVQITETCHCAFLCVPESTFFHFDAAKNLLFKYIQQAVKILNLSIYQENLN